MVSLLFRSLVGDLQDLLNHTHDPSVAPGLVVLSTGPYVASKFAFFVVAGAALFATSRTES
jgi:hypothetical protein